MTVTESLDERADSVASDIEADSSDNESSSGSEPEPVLAITRERRANAGNRMSKLLELAEAEDAQQEEDYGKIFEEAADDLEFEAQDDADGDVNMDSSSEDEDVEKPDDEDAGEKEITRQERKEKSKKRKRESLLQDAMKRAAARVGPKAIPTPTTKSPATTDLMRPRKKSERVSWLPETSISSPLRASSRHSAVQNKNAVHERLKEKEKHRLRTVAIMKAAERRKEASDVKPMTQEERIEEAARVERQNSKSLNRWEAAERQRQEEQQARLAALKNHRLSGPIITYYSGPALWINDKLRRTGKEALSEDTNERPSTAGSEDNAAAPELDSASQPMDLNRASAESRTKAEPGRDTRPSVSPSERHSTFSASAAAHTQPYLSTPFMKQEPNATSTFLSGIEAFASGNTHDSPAQLDEISHKSQSPHVLSHTPSSVVEPSAIVSYETPTLPLQSSGSTPDSIQHHDPASLLAQFQTTFSAQPESTATPKVITQIVQAQSPPPLKLPPRREIATRILITLRDFPQEPPVYTANKKEPDFIRHQLLGWPAIVSKRITAPSKKPPTCALTGQVARYCDPATGLYYVDASALKGMRWVIAERGRWSTLTGTFAHADQHGDGIGKVGANKGRAAKGVPEMFNMRGEELKKKREQILARRQVEAAQARENQEKTRLEAEARLKLNPPPPPPLPPAISSIQNPSIVPAPPVPNKPAFAVQEQAPVEASHQQGAAPTPAARAAQ